MENLKTVQEIVREAEDNYVNGTTALSEYVNWSMHETIERIDAYLNSTHTSGSTDSLGRPKPFFNIVTAASNIWYHATDLDRKDIRVLPDKATNTAAAFIATVHLQEWMRREKFGTFLNQWGRTLARYGSAVVKFVPKDGRLIPSVVPWNRFIADPVQFDAIPRIEKFYMTPAQMRKMKDWDQDVVEDLIKSAKQSRETMGGQQKDNSNNFIEVYEVHGELDERLLEDQPGDVEVPTYRQQMHVVSFIAKEGGKKHEYDDFTLYRGRERKDPYMITHLIEEDGRTLAIGAVEHLFHAQWMVNHSVKNMKDTLDLASKLIFQTADTLYSGRNVLAAMETGQILLHKENMPLTRLANDKPDVQAFMAYGDMWKQLGTEVTSTPDAVKGQTLPSGTPYSLGALLTQNATSLFEQMTENKGLHLEDMMREHIIPFIKTKMDTKDEVVAVLTEQQISEIDAMYVPNQAVRNYNERVLDDVVNDKIPSPFNPQVEQQQVKQQLSAQGNRRSFKPDDLDEKTWKEALKDLEWEVVIEITNENTDKQVVLSTLSAVLQTVASNPQVLQDPNAKLIFNAILTETGKISPMQLSATAAQPAPIQSPALQELPKQV